MEIVITDVSEEIVAFETSEMFVISTPHNKLSAMSCELYEVTKGRHINSVKRIKGRTAAYMQRNKTTLRIIIPISVDVIQSNLLDRTQLVIPIDV